VTSSLPYIYRIKKHGIMILSTESFDCLQPIEQFFSYLHSVTITGDKTAKTSNLNLYACLERMAFGSEDSFSCHTCCDTGPPFLRSYPKDP
jgi:hypothetical protein